MKIILMSVGTRGDMEPFLAIGELLEKKGHQVICAFPEQFRNLAINSNLEFASLGNKFIVYTISPSLFPKPDYWDDNIQVLGFHERHTDQHWQPDKDLQDFLEKHDRILFVTFGSMTNPNPEEKTAIILDILQRNGISAIINTASRGLVKPQEFNTDLFHFVSEIPYNWIFTKVYGVIHHGGSGTTHKSLKYGCPTMIIPHIIDGLGAGPKGIKIGNISKRNLEPKILELMNNASFKKNAEKIRETMRKDDYCEELYRAIVH